MDGNKVLDMEAHGKSQCSHPRSEHTSVKPMDIHQVPSYSHVLIPTSEGPSNPWAKHQDRKEAPRHTVNIKRQTEARQEPRLGFCDGVYRWRSFAHSKEGVVLCWCFLTTQLCLLSIGESLSTTVPLGAAWPAWKISQPIFWLLFPTQSSHPNLKKAVWHILKPSPKETMSREGQHPQQVRQPCQVTLQVWVSFLFRQYPIQPAGLLSQQHQWPGRDAGVWTDSQEKCVFPQHE